MDLTRLLPGPVCTQHLADMGADVIKVEDPEGGDYMRAMGDPPGLIFELINRNKRSICLNIKNSRHRDDLLRLARTADVFVESFRPGVADRLGIGYETVRAVNPRLVYCSLTGFGQTGPLRDMAGHDINFLALTGIADQIGSRDGPPSLSNLQIADLLGGAACAAMSILAAIVGVLRNGRGRYLDVAMSDCSMAHAVIPAAAVAGSGLAKRGEDLLTGGLPGYGIYATADGRFMALGALEQKFWSAFCRAVQKPAWEDKNTTQEPLSGEMRAAVAALFQQRTQAQWSHLFEQHDCCVTPVLRLDEARSHPQFVTRNLIRTDGGFNFPVPLRGGQVESQAPKLGLHTDEILGALEG